MTMAKSLDALVIKNDGTLGIIPHNKSIMNGEGHGDVHNEVAALVAEREEKNEDLLRAAMELIRDTQRVSSATMQRRLGISYNRACLVLDTLQERGVIGPARGDEAREILMDLDDVLADDTAKEEVRPGAKKGRQESFTAMSFAFDTKVLGDRLPALLNIMSKVGKVVRDEHTKLVSEINPATEKRVEALSKILQVMSSIPSKAVVVRTDNAQVARLENQEIEKKIYAFLKGMGMSFNSFMGSDLDKVIVTHQEVTIGILKREGYPLAEIMTPDAKVRFGFIGYIPDEADPFRKINWSKDQIRMSVIFRNPSAKKGEDPKIRIPRELGLRYSNLNILNQVVKEYVDLNYKPYNKFVNEMQVRRFRDAHGEYTDNDGIRWVKRNGDPQLTAFDDKGIFGKPGTLLGHGKIIRTKNNASFTWWETSNPELPRNALITAATENIIRMASTARIET